MIFVSHASKDMKIATALCRGLEQRGVGCWISSRDIAPGANYQDAIDRAIRAARAMVLVFTGNANDSPEILKELSLASAYRVVVIPVRAEDVLPTGAFKYELSTRQWIDLFDHWDQALEKVAEQVGRIAPREDTGDNPPAMGRGTGKTVRRRAVAAAVLAVLCGVGGLAAYVIETNHGPALRSTPAMLSRGQVDAMLTRLDLYDARQNGGGRGVRHRYKAVVIGDAVVIADRATGLMWQKAGSHQGMPLAATGPYVDRLNAGKYAGFTGWRLPTLEEAMSLNEPQAFADYHIAPEFVGGSNASFIWTSDRSADGQRGFVVYYYDGILAAESPDLNAYVRAVRHLSP
jgi:ribosomal protein S18